MLAGGEEEEEDDAPPEIVTNLLDKLPITGTFEGEKFFVETPEGTQATQLTGTHRVRLQIAFAYALEILYRAA